MIDLRLFGPPEISGSEGTQIAWAVTQPKRLALLAYLAAARPFGLQRRDTLLGLFWPELNEQRARAALSQAVYYLRRNLGNDVIASRGEDQVGLSPEVRCDVVAFRQHISQQDYGSALNLYRGPLLSGFFVSDLVEFERWVEEERQQLAQQAANAAWRLVEGAVARGDEADALRYAQRATEISPEMDERAVRQLLSLHDRLGDRSSALEVYQRFAARLHDEYEAEPAPETRALLSTIRQRVAAHRSEPQIHAQPAEMNVAQKQRTPRRWIAAATLGVAVIAAIASWQLLRPKPLSSGQVAVLPFTYNGPPASAHVAESITSLLTAGLNASPGMNTVDPQALHGAAERGGALTRRAAEQLAKQFGADVYVLGAVTAAGDNMRVTATLYAIGSFAARTQATAEGSANEIFALADRLTAQLIASGIPSGGTVEGSAARTTHSLTALRAYLEGERAYRAGRYASALEAFQRAVSEDSTFALAYLRLSNAANWAGAPGVVDGATTNALRYIGRLSESDSLMVQAWSAYLRGPIDESQRLYSEVLRADSSNVEAWLHLAEIRYHYGSRFGFNYTTSRPFWERTLKLDPYNVGALTHLARIAAVEQQRSEFEQLATRVAALNPARERTIEIEALRAFAFGDATARARAASAIITTNSGNVRVDILRGAELAAPGFADVPELAARVMRTGQNFRRWEAGEMALVAGFLLANGERKRADALLDSAALLEPERVLVYHAATLLPPAIEAPPEVAKRVRAALARPPSAVALTDGMNSLSRLYLLGTLAARDGQIDEANRMRATLRATRPGGNDALSLIERLLDAQILHAQGRHAEALAALGPAGAGIDVRRSVWTHFLAEERFLRGELLAALGREREALGWYETFPDPATFNVFYLPAAKLRIAQINKRLSPSNTKR